MELPYRLPKTKNKLLQDPHVVIIGAGASKAACPYDKFGKSVPLLKNIHEALGLSKELLSLGFSPSALTDFEALYSEIYQKAEFDSIRKKIEREVETFFRQLVIPDEVTLYDYLVLSLTYKDAIISFNWDPFLLQAYRRNAKVGNLPQLFFPHGNVGVGLCYSCKRKGYSNCLCENCFAPLENMPLLFPVRKKNYYDRGIIENEWNCAEDYLRRAAGVTVWGYGAPVSDMEAYNLIKHSFVVSNIIDIAPFTIINLPENEQTEKEKWQDIFSQRMINYVGDFRESILWRFPRVSLETIYDAILQQHPRIIQKSFREFGTLEDLHAFVKTINEFEMAL